MGSAASASNSQGVHRSVLCVNHTTTHSKWPTKILQLWSSTMVQVCAKPGSLGMMHPERCSPPSWVDPVTRVSWSVWDRRTPTSGRGAEQERYPDAEVPHRARHRDQLGRHGEDLAPHLLQRTSSRTRRTSGPPHRSPLEPQS